jgi:hypothetical protein
MRRSPRGIGIHLEDVGAIPRIDQLPGASWYQLRARVRAGEGDLVLSTRPAPPGYEHYNRERLGLGEVRWVLARDGGKGAEVARCAGQDPECFELLTGLARGSETYLHPYMADGDVWELSRRLTVAVGRSVPVLGPPPELCRYVNDKVRFLSLVEAVLGPEAAGEHRASADAAELAQGARDLARKGRQIGLKRPDCSSALGNRVLPSARILELPEADLVRLVQGLLLDMGWEPGETALVTYWEESPLSSPSVQLWIPPAGEGPVLCEGIFRQLFAAGSEGRFAGAVLAALPAELDRRLRQECVALATVLQRLGYVGRCSFDAILVGERLEEAAIRYVDGNGRWGGVSTPVTLLNRLFGDHRSQGYAVGDCAAPGLVGLPFAELARQLEPDLYGSAHPEGHLILYNVGCLAESGKFGVICLGRDPLEAEERLLDLPRRLACDLTSTVSLS